MARRTGNPLVDILITLIMFALVFLAIIALTAPLYFLIRSFYYKYKIKKKYSSLNGNYKDFWISEADKKEFVDSTIKKNEALLKIKKANKIGEEEDISINMDGRFSRRSRLGKQLRRLIEENEDKAQTYQYTSTRIARLPLERWNDFAALKKNFKAHILALFFWLLGVFGAIQFLITEKIIRLDGDYFDINRWISSLNANDNALILVYLSLLFALLISGIGYFLGLWRGAVNAQNLSPEPPIVSMDNVLLY